MIQFINIKNKYKYISIGTLAKIRMPIHSFNVSTTELAEIFISAIIKQLNK